MSRYDVGYDKEQILTTRFSAAMLKEQNAITAKLKQSPDILDVAYSSQNLVADKSMWGLGYKGKMIVPYFFPVSYNFLSTMNIPILEGRDFTVEDKAASGRYIFNQTAQKEFGVKVGDNIQNHNRNMTALSV